MRRYRLPYWAFVPTLGVWPDAADRAGAGATGIPGAVTANVPLSSSGSVAVNLENGRVTILDGKPEDPDTNANAAAAATAANVATAAANAANAVNAAEPIKRRRLPVKQQFSNTPSVGGPSWLRRTTVVTAASTAVATDSKAEASAINNATARPVTRIYLKPSARAKAGAGGVALSNPISTAVVRRGDTVSIEYMPDALAEVGEGGVAISRPELVIRLVD